MYLLYTRIYTYSLYFLYVLILLLYILALYTHIYLLSLISLGTSTPALYTCSIHSYILPCTPKLSYSYPQILHTLDN
jgi:hypothetical protein